MFYENVLKFSKIEKLILFYLINYKGNLKIFQNKNY